MADNEMYQKIFRFFFIAKFNETDGATITYSWPPSITDPAEIDLMKTAPKFAVPFYGYTCEAVEKYCFVMTSSEYVKTYGFCRFSPTLDSCLCIMTLNPWFEFFYFILDKLTSDVLENKKDPGPYLDALRHYRMHYPLSHTRISFDGIIMDPWVLPKIPPEHGLPKLIESKTLLEYYNAISPATIIDIFTLMLLESRMVFFSSKLGRLTSCIQAACSLLYPLSWQHILIPIMTPNFIEYIGCPTPNIIGVHRGLQSRAKDFIQKDASGVFEVSLDENEIHVDRNQANIPPLPDAVHYFLDQRLKRMTPDRNGRVKNDPLDDDNFARAFLDTMVALIGDYREGFVISNEKILDPFQSEDNFNREKFIASKPDSYREFLEALVGTQHFRMFCRDRAIRLNQGGNFNDEFEKARIHNKPLSAPPQQVKRVLNQWKTKLTFGTKEGLRVVRDKSADVVKRIAERRNHQFPNHASVNDFRITGSVPDLSEARNRAETVPNTASQENQKKVPEEQSCTKHYDIITDAELEQHQQFTSLMDDPDIQAVLQRSRSDPDILDHDSTDEDEEVKQDSVEQAIKPSRPRAPSRDLPLISSPRRPPPPRPTQPPLPLRTPPKPPRPTCEPDLQRRSAPVRPKPRRSLRQSIMDSEPALISISPDERPVNDILQQFDPVVMRGDETATQPEKRSEDIDLLLSLDSFASPAASRPSQSFVRSMSILDEALPEETSAPANVWPMPKPRNSNWTTFE